MFAAKGDYGTHVRLAFSISWSFLAPFSTIDTCFSTIPVLVFLGVVVPEVVFFDRQPVFFDDEDPEHESHSLSGGSASKRQSTCRVDGPHPCT
jgi:hypothetical protein